jgi:alanine racemase
MRRLGFTETEIDDLIDILNRNDRVRIVSLFSHLAASEDKKHDDFTLYQIEVFEKMSKRIMENIKYPVLRHILNSAGIERFTRYQFDMVRLGIGLYGFSSVKSKDLTFVGKLKTTVSQIKKINKDDTIGYGRMGKLEQDSTIAIIPVGYADGLPRGLGNKRGRLYINNTPVSIIGNISMDMCTVNISGLNIKEGDEVIVFDSAEHIIETAKILKTIPYEIMTNISNRVKRTYYK